MYKYISCFGFQTIHEIFPWRRWNWHSIDVNNAPNMMKRNWKETKTATNENKQFVSHLMSNDSTMFSHLLEQIRRWKKETKNYSMFDHSSMQKHRNETKSDKKREKRREKENEKKNKRTILSPFLLRTTERKEFLCNKWNW